MTKEKKANYRPWWFKGLKKLMRGRYKKPNFVYLGDEISNGSIILSNHEGTDAPMSFEIYSNKQIRFWGASEMNSGLIQLYKYQSKVYYHEKKHWNLFLARLFCLIASPLTNLFYKGLNLISTYRDSRFRNTLKESFDSIKNGDNIVIFPEQSNEGYKEILDGFHSGYVIFADYCLKKGYDLPIYVAYFSKKQKTYLIDAPIQYSQLKEKYIDREAISKFLCDRCNYLGKMLNDEQFLEKYNIK